MYICVVKTLIDGSNTIYPSFLLLGSQTTLESISAFCCSRGQWNEHIYFKFNFDRIQSKLADWKMRLLNKAGRVTLWLPSSVCYNINRLVWNFIWGRSDGGNGLHLMNWNTVSRAKKVWWVGLRYSRVVNISPLGKHSWQMLMKGNKLWVQMYKQ